MHHKLFLITLLTLCLMISAEAVVPANWSQMQTVYNPWTMKLDYIYVVNASAIGLGTFVQKAGDTMSGNLQLNEGNLSFYTAGSGQTVTFGKMDDSGNFYEIFPQWLNMTALRFLFTSSTGKKFLELYPSGNYAAWDSGYSAGIKFLQNVTSNGDIIGTNLRGNLNWSYLQNVPSFITAHNQLTNLTWSTAGHTIDTDVVYAGYGLNFTNSSQKYNATENCLQFTGPTSTLHVC